MKCEGKTDFYINMTPTSISLECPHCDIDIELDFRDINVPDYWGDDWGTVKCLMCGKDIELGEYELD